MAEPLHVDDGFWAVLELLLPERLHQRIGRPVELFVLEYQEVGSERQRP